VQCLYIDCFLFFPFQHINAFLLIYYSYHGQQYKQVMHNVNKTVSRLTTPLTVYITVLGNFVLIILWQLSKFKNLTMLEPESPIY
jgi:hypothetical protein